MNALAVGDLFSEEELRRTFKILDKHEGKEAIDLLVKEITEPALPRLNKITGQENDARYFAYALEYVYLRVNE